MPAPSSKRKRANVRLTKLLELRSISISASIEIENAKGVHDALFLRVLLNLLPGDVMSRTYLESPIVKATQALLVLWQGREFL